MAFEIASTNLVIELGVILALLMGWQFTAAEFAGGPVMIVIIAVLFRLFLPSGCLARRARRPTAAVAGSMEGHAAMDMSVGGAGLVRAAAAVQRTASPRSPTCSSWSGPRSSGTW